MAPVQDYTAIFADAYLMHGQGMDCLERGDIRDAAEKAWCATRGATDALIMAITGEPPSTTAATTNNLDSLAREITDVRHQLQGRYYSRIHNLHGLCFYAGFCNDQTERRIRETFDYIRDAERLAEQLATA